jgi:hypothetical protein
MSDDFEKVDKGFDPNARADAERRIYEHLVSAMGLKDRQSAFLNQTPEAMNACGFEFVPMGIAEKLVIRMRFADRAVLEGKYDQMCNALPMRSKDGRIVYVGFRFEHGYERSVVTDALVQIAPGKSVTVWASDVELRAIFGLRRMKR